MNRKEIKALNKQILELKKQYDNAVKEYKDGFIYIVVIYCYGSRNSVTLYNDIACAEELANWWDDNGIARCITNNPKFKIDKYRTRDLIIHTDPITKAAEI